MKPTQSISRLATRMLCPILLLLSGCATTVEQGGGSRDAPLTTGLDIHALREIVDEMAESMISSLSVQRSLETFRSQNPGQALPVIVQGPLQNKTRSRIDLNIVNNQLRSRLINSGMFQVIDRRADQAIAMEIDYQQTSGLVDASDAPRFGHMMNASYQLDTEVLELRTEAGRVREVTYSVKMELRHLETGYTVWINTMEIDRTQTRRLMGR